MKLRRRQEDPRPLIEVLAEERFSYELAPSGGLHAADRDCRYRRSNVEWQTISSQDSPEEVWERLWVLYDEGWRDGTAPPVPVLSDNDAVVYLGCLDCIQEFAIERGWVNTHEAIPGRRHK
jgi:hypothetical protein